MTSTDREFGFITIPRALLSAAAGIVFNVERAVVGDARVRTARRNAYEAVLADRARARHRAEMNVLVASLSQVAVGSSPRSSASHASLVGSTRA